MSNTTADNTIINTSRNNSCNNSENYLESCSYTIRLINKLKSLDASNNLNFKLITKAIHWARKYHGEQMRK